ncbi:MAG TPA: hypothetical protein VHE81_23480, partial [Lacipirellulaceae bacterium]|nr:hypothetical protein [Lacipirellulaceae bacterium]
MIFNETAAAYGFFQIVFSDVVDHLAAATFLLRKLREPKLDFKEVFRQNVSRTLLQFETELTQFDGRPSMKDDLDDLRAACK